MAVEPVVRTSYTDPTDPANGLRLGDTVHAESLVDQKRYIDPLARAHGSAVHGWGIGTGLAVTATAGQPGLRVHAGVAVDADGRTIVLALTGKAEVGPLADNVGVAPTLTDVPIAGAALPTTDLTGAFYVTITWRETFDADLWNASTYTIFRMLLTPWLRLVPVANVTDATDVGQSVVLGRVHLAAGVVTALTHERRREVLVPAGTLRFSRGQGTSPAPGLRVENTTTGEVRARDAGGLEVSVRGPADQLEFRRRDGNTTGNIAKVAFSADQTVARRADGLETVVIDSQRANIRLGVPGVEGDVVVNDGSGRRVIVLDGGDSSVTIGAPGNEGDLRLLDGNGQASVRVDGNTGTVWEKRLAASAGGVIDVDAFALRIHGGDLVLDGRSKNNKRALVDWQNQQLHVNFDGDYTGGVVVRGLHLADHIRTGSVEGADISKRPTYQLWVNLVEFSTNLPASEWRVVSFCDVGMFDDGGVDNFWWGLRENDYVDGSGNTVVRWQANYHDRGDDWRPWHWNATWIAFRK